MEGLLKQMFDNLFKLHGSFKMFKSLLLKEDGDGASRTSTGKEFQRSGARFEKDTRPARLFARNGRKEFSCPLVQWRWAGRWSFAHDVDGASCFTHRRTWQANCTIHRSTMLVSRNSLRRGVTSSWYLTPAAQRIAFRQTARRRFLRPAFMLGFVPKNWPKLTCGRVFQHNFISKANLKNPEQGFF